MNQQIWLIKSARKVSMDAEKWVNFNIAKSSDIIAKNFNDYVVHLPHFTDGKTKV